MKETTQPCTRIEHIRKLFNATFHGGAWHGSSVLELTKELSVSESSFKAGNVHTIAELIYHITSWRIFALKKMQGDAGYNVDVEKNNFGNFTHIDRPELETLMMEMTLSHNELMEELNSKKDEFLDDIVPGAEYTFFMLLHGIIHHDLYHAGQIAILKKLSHNQTHKPKTQNNRYFEDHYDDFI